MLDSKLSYSLIAIVGTVAISYIFLDVIYSMVLPSIVGGITYYIFYKKEHKLLDSDTTKEPIHHYKISDKFFVRREDNYLILINRHGDFIKKFPLTKNIKTKKENKCIFTNTSHMYMLDSNKMPTIKYGSRFDSLNGNLVKFKNGSIYDIEYITNNKFKVKNDVIVKDISPLDNNG